MYQKLLESGRLECHQKQASLEVVIFFFEKKCPPKKKLHGKIQQQQKISEYDSEIFAGHESRWIFVYFQVMILLKKSLPINQSDDVHSS